MPYEDSEFDGPALAGLATRAAHETKHGPLAWTVTKRVATQESAWFGLATKAVYHQSTETRLKYWDLAMLRRDEETVTGPGIWQRTADERRLVLSKSGELLTIYIEERLPAGTQAGGVGIKSCALATLEDILALDYETEHRTSKLPGVPDNSIEVEALIYRGRTVLYDRKGVGVEIALTNLIG